MIETYLLEQFAAFARCGTLLKAAEELHISQPTLSRSMKKLEEEIGVPLFHRENSKIALNETGMVAADYAQRALRANREVVEQAVAHDRSLRTVTVGSCSPFPFSELLPILQERFPEKTISSEVAGDEKLAAGLKNHSYQLVILHGRPEGTSFFGERFLEERLYISLAKDHPLAGRESLRFADLRGIPVLMGAGVGFWMDVCREHLAQEDLLIQTNPDALAELAAASHLPLFNSDQYLRRGAQPAGRVSIPISDPEARATYWLTCLASEQKTYRAVFRAASISVASH